ncbi:MAG: ImmA/IrrE family metallo-endopeptidase [Clostridia bacterium]|nr:ImmA/IrrE family metallo-endopeptidase [Clostridia bacterium]
MTIETIRGVVADLRRRYGDLPPEKMCDELGILLQRTSMGRMSNACKGFFILKARIRLIVLNSDLSRSTQRVVLYHELGHAVLHSEAVSACQFHDFDLFDETDTYEYEANIFAAEYALPDEAVLEQLNEDTSFFGAASRLRVPPELLDFKFRILKRQGYALIPPLNARSNFMKDIDRANRF